MSRFATALVHDYLTQRGGAERVVLSLERAFPGSPVFTSLFEPDLTFPEFKELDIRTTQLNRSTLLRRRHRLALPLLAPTFSRLHIPADVAICSSSGWAHGARVDGRKIVYCHAPARWLYQPDRYFRRGTGKGRRLWEPVGNSLKTWDRRAALTADRYVANSTDTRRRIKEIYGVEAEVIHPPISLDPGSEQTQVDRIEGGFFLCVSRLLEYKNVEHVIEAFTHLQNEQLVVVGEGPLKERLLAIGAKNVHLLGSVNDAQLRWLYAQSIGLVAASYEDFGLTPVEAAAFGRPTAALRSGGFLDTVIDGETGVLFDAPSAECIAQAVRQMSLESWDGSRIAEHASRFSEDRFASRLREIVTEERAAIRKSS